jgi:hypothetical protein
VTEKFRLTNKQRLILKQLQKDGTLPALYANKVVFHGDRCYAVSGWRVVSFKTKKHSPGHYLYDPKNGTVTPVEVDKSVDTVLKGMATKQDYKCIPSSVSGLLININRMWEGVTPGSETSINPRFLIDILDAGESSGSLYVPVHKDAKYVLFEEQDGTVWFMGITLIKTYGRFERVKFGTGG